MKTTAFRIWLFGSSDVDTTSLIRRLSGEHSEARSFESGGYTEFPLIVDSVPVILELYDRRPPDSAHALLAVFDLYEPKSFDEIVPKSRSFKNDKKPVFIAANRTEKDCDASSYISWCKEQAFRFLFVSIATGTGIKSLLSTIGRDMLRDYMKRRLQVCRDITQMIFDHPQSESFREDPTPWVNGYTEVIKSPMWIKRVLEKLDNGQYLTVEKWQSDMNLIWDNCKLFNGNSPTYNIDFKPTVDELRRVTRKERLRAFGPSTLDRIAAQLTATVEAVTGEIEQYMRVTPEVIPACSGYSESDRRLPFNDRDFSELIKGVGSLTEKVDQQHLAQAVRSLGLATVDKGEYEDIDVADIPDSARVYLRFFLKERAGRKIE
jgi:hypothetical protein